MTVEERIKGRKIGIIGMARSGVAAALLAQKLGGRPFVSDIGGASNLADQLQQLKTAGIPFETDGHTDHLLDCDYIIISPGIPLTSEIVGRIQKKGLPIFSEIEFAFWVCQGKIVAVTGSNGKTTTTTLIGEIFKEAGLKTYVCGNIGLPFAEVVADIPPDGVAVVEVSNFQLETIADFKPQIAMILNLTEDHLDRHGGFEEYKKAKYRITENQTADDHLILNRDDANTKPDVITTSANKLLFSTSDSAATATFVRNGTLYLRRDGSEEDVIACNDILIPGPHNLQNAAAAALATSLLGVNVNSMKQTLSTFTGVEHRLERVDNIAGITFVNDSKATNVDSVRFALQSIPSPLYLIAGGRDKGASYEPLVKHGRGKIKGIIAIGEASEKIMQELGREFPVQFAGSIQEAVHRCFDMAYPGETVLLSPACASFDMFENFEQRGLAFKEAVRELRDGKKNHQSPKV
ncbi:MAG: UDP-N-acetylmuramoyl-L-alanine--D-glutamate ligase [candidate division Zixibacteria bacterium]|nr:UDP-N-acetylmuramoyl-L-alanine--D-glutamate ligase [candidate division Zixibacteria bacterium]